MAGNAASTILGEMRSRGRRALGTSAWSERDLPRKLVANVNRLAYSRASQMLIDSALVAATLWASYALRFDGDVPVPYGRQLLLLLPVRDRTVLGYQCAVGS